jgi:hypothetical protein
MRCVNGELKKKKMGPGFQLTKVKSSTESRGDSSKSGKLLPEIPESRGVPVDDTIPEIPGGFRKGDA